MEPRRNNPRRHRRRYSGAASARAGNQAGVCRRKDTAAATTKNGESGANQSSTVAGRPGVMSISNAKAVATYAPRPQYPYEARSRHITGSGVCVL